MTLSPTAPALLADGVLVVHVCIAVFVVAGLAVIVLGNLAGWRWVNNLWFRLIHLVAISVVTVEAWLGLACPLTLLEMSLRAQAGATVYAGGFVEHWLSRVLYYEAPPWVFVLAYSAFGLLVFASWWYFPPARKHASGEQSPNPSIEATSSSKRRLLPAAPHVKR